MWDRRYIKALPLLLGFLILIGCSAGTVPPEKSPMPCPPPYQTQTARTPMPTEDPREAALRERRSMLAGAVSVAEPVLGAGFPAEDFLLWLEKGHYPQLLSDIRESAGRSLESMLWEQTGRSLHVLRDSYLGILDSQESAREAGIYFAPEAGNADKTVVLAFGGDVNLIDGSYVMPKYRVLGGGVSAVLTGGLLEEMLAADVLLINNEFAFTDRGEATYGKTYCFRANPENVRILVDMGVDVALLANNHVFDYGADGLYDTLKTLDEAAIPRIGAGMNLDEAARPVYYIAGGRKIAYIGAGCIERYTVFTPGATESSPGIFRSDEKNPEPLLSVIRACAENSDFVVVNLHWGTESTSVLDSYQRTLGRMCVDAGADAVIGSHPHVLQGAEFYNGKPIIYSTGNFWFSQTPVKTGLFELILDESGTVSLRLLPCQTGGGVTRLQSGDDAAHTLSYYQSISFGVVVDADGYITPG